MLAELYRTPGQSAILPGAVRAGDLIFTLRILSASASASAAAQMADPEAVPVPVARQIREALAILLQVVADAGGAADTVIKIEAYLARAEDFAEWNRQYLAIWPQPGPARTTLVAGFAGHGIGVEVQAIAAALSGTFR